MAGQQQIEPFTAGVLSVVLSGFAWLWFAGSFAASRAEWWTFPFLPLVVHGTSIWLAWKTPKFVRLLLVPLLVLSALPNAAAMLLLMGKWFGVER